MQLCQPLQILSQAHVPEYSAERQGFYRNSTLQNRVSSDPYPYQRREKLTHGSRQIAAGDVHSHSHCSFRATSQVVRDERNVSRVRAVYTSSSNKYTSIDHTWLSGRNAHDEAHEDNDLERNDEDGTLADAIREPCHNQAADGGEYVDWYC